MKQRKYRAVTDKGDMMILPDSEWSICFYENGGKPEAFAEFCGLGDMQVSLVQVDDFELLEDKQ